ncbi:peroxisomal trans-2-enoyl-CoA reductase-like [Acanthaster planci]|uniref:Peroxisomal trans-2-enoyl-CoA reductase n=1 Tax=Acanthaster planci TaxID=133434 RepID=A0A8B8A439_ACAPL|nr:peroxisomal trans-2-enoyl-CoA reductase-like [Acanthaster planci]
MPTSTGRALTRGPCCHATAWLPDATLVWCQHQRSWELTLHGSINMAVVSSVFRSGLFSNKVAIVTGGATGIGRAISQELLYLGCKVIIASRNLERLQKAVQEMKEQIPQKSTADIREVKCNIRKEDEVKSLMDSTLQHYGKIDYLVNNGGGQFLSLLADVRLKGWNAVIETNLTGTFLCCREVYKKWMAEHGGAIVNIIVDMWKGFPAMGHTAAARAAVENLTKTASLEWAASGIRINSVAPGTIYSDTAAANYGDPAIFTNAIPSIPAKRLGKVEEVAAAVCFLLSPAAAYITGETLKVDGGSSLHGLSGWTVPDHNGFKAYDWKSDIEDRNRAKEEVEKSKL